MKANELTLVEALRELIADARTDDYMAIKARLYRVMEGRVEAVADAVRVERKRVRAIINGCYCKDDRLTPGESVAHNDCVDLVRKAIEDER